MIRRTLTPYLVTLAVCCLGLWLVLERGRHLRAPEYLAGTWVEAEPGASTDDAEPMALPLHIHQSGRYFQIAEGAQSPQPYTLAEQRLIGGEDVYRAQMTITNGATTWRVEGPVVEDAYYFERLGAPAFRKVLRRLSTSEAAAHPSP